MIRVLILEDEPTAAEEYAAYVGRVAGFIVGGSARTAIEAHSLLAETHFDLVLLDIHLPGASGIDFLRAIRAAGHSIDVIALMNLTDLDAIRASVSFGVVYYLVKPFTFGTLRNRLEHYRAYHSQLTSKKRRFAQQDVDQLWATLRSTEPVSRPRGLSPESLKSVVVALEGAPAGTGLSATEVAHVLGASRVTARRYLEYLVQDDLALRHYRYGRAHRPEVEYRLRSRGGE
jgi:response regulator of citrate/malate metabolism